MAGKILKATVVKKSGDKTVMCECSFLRKHPIYKKYIKLKKKYMVHDSDNSSNIGYEVLIREGRPLSRKKSWYIVKEEKGE